MLSKLFIKICSISPLLSRPLLRQYLHRVGWVPAGTQWILLDLKNRLIPSRSIRTVSLGYGLRLEIDLSNAMGREIYYHGAHEPEIASFLSNFLKPGMTFVDVGANVGEVTMLAAHLVGNQGKVYAVEVSPNTLPRLRRNLALNELANVEIVEAAICDRDDPVSFYLGKGMDSGSSSISQPHDYFGEMLTVPGMRLDTLASSRSLHRIDCIKMDIEGAEMAALRGCERLLAGPYPPVVIFEYHRDVASRMGWTLDEASGLLRNYGYTVELLTGKERDAMRSNIIATPPDSGVRVASDTIGERSSCVSGG